MELLKTNQLGFTYDNEKYVLKDIDISFEKGKAYGIFGKSGAGKSTLLFLLAGLETASLGNIFYKGKDISKINRDTYRCNEIGVIFQSYNLLMHLTALENVILSMDISHVKIDNPKEKALDILKNVGINEDKANRKILLLSGGEQQRVAIARALSYDCEIILADEPTGNLDSETEESIIELLIDLAHKFDKCVIIISHSTRVKRNVDVIHELMGGRLKKQ